MHDLTVAMIVIGEGLGGSILKDAGNHVFFHLERKSFSNVHIIINNKITVLTTQFFSRIIWRITKLFIQNTIYLYRLLKNIFFRNAEDVSGEFSIHWFRLRNQYLGHIRHKIYLSFYYWNHKRDLIHSDGDLTLLWNRRSYSNWRPP